MPEFETSRVFAIEPETRNIAMRHNGDIQPVDMDQPASMYRSMFQATGLHRYDFAVFGASFTDDGADEHGLLVLSHQQGIGTLVDADYLEANPELLTAELAKKLASVERLQLEEFTIEPILVAIGKRFPHARGFSK